MVLAKAMLVMLEQQQRMLAKILLAKLSRVDVTLDCKLFGAGTIFLFCMCTAPSTMWYWSMTGTLDVITIHNIITMYVDMVGACGRELGFRMSAIS